MLCLLLLIVVLLASAPIWGTALLTVLGIALSPFTALLRLTSGNAMQKKEAKNLLLYVIFSMLLTLVMVTQFSK